MSYDTHPNMVLSKINNISFRPMQSEYFPREWKIFSNEEHA